MAYSIEQFFGEDIIYLAMMLAIPAHLLVIATIIKFRKTTFAASYFVLACSVLFSDAFMCATNIIFNLLIRTPMGPGIIKNGTQTIILWDQAIYSALSIVFRNSNQWALLAIAINRFIFVCFPTKASNIWTVRVTVVCVVGQWAIGLLFGAVWQPSMLIFRIPNTTIDAVVPNVDEGKFWSSIIGISNMGTIVAIFCLYSIMFCIVRAHTKRMSNTVGRSTQQQNGNKTETKLAIQAVIYSLFLIPQVVLSVLMLVLPPPPPPPANGPMPPMPVSQTVTYIMNHVTDANYYTTSFVMLIMTQTLRDHVRKFIGGTAVQNITTDNRSSTLARTKRLSRSTAAKQL